MALVELVLMLQARQVDVASILLKGSWKGTQLTMSKNVAAALVRAAGENHPAGLPGGAGEGAESRTPEAVGPQGPGAVLLTPSAHVSPLRPGKRAASRLVCGGACSFALLTSSQVMPVCVGKPHSENCCLRAGLCTL